MKVSRWRKVLAVLSLLACAGAPALALAQEKPAEINIEAVEGLVKYTIIAVDQANLTGNYTVLRGLATPQFQKNTTPAMLAKSFARMRQTRVEMSTILLVKPSFTTPPALDKGVLKVAGVFPTSPTQIAFQATYVNVKGRMRLAGLKITPTKAAADAATTAGKKADQQP
ncbi:MAG: hypothetical protein AB7F09_16900 [Parvibaculaceae bacterium]